MTSSDANEQSSSLQETTYFGRLCGVRHVQVLLLFLCLTVNFLMRVNLSVAIVVMTDTGTASNNPVFNWTMAEQTQIQSVFYFGYFVMNVISAVLATIYSNKLLLFLSVSLSSAITLVTPTIVAIGGRYALLLSRVFLGVMQGMMMSNVMSLMSKWIPPTERSRCGSFIIGGMNFGTLVSFSTSGWIGFHFGWPSIYYFSGGLGAVWALTWLILAADSPENCWYITKKERDFVLQELFQCQITAGKSRKIPWKKILTNKACFALILTTIGHYWGNMTLLAEMPTYFKAVLHLHTTHNGMISALPYACMMVFSLLFSCVVDILIKRGRVSVTSARKSCNSIGQWGAAACLVVLSYCKHESTIVTMYTLGATLLGFSYFGFNINHLDIVPKYAGFFMGITNALSNISNVLGPLFVGFIVYDAENKQQWRTVFWVSAIIWFIGNSIFIIFGSGEPQDFSEDEVSEDTSVHQRSN
ncbi:putative inorganic phosphate cotransporter [Halyomorpha halys]|uniref:putative inorganic phosphate cotransporter n=1 Tax=Halyomorpha halys TaxID=286706 RepID=UPI0006D4E259|nr:putative inorganic phosphate cotransporter isoform X1 [Halyomorpha halys]